jgi:hypothetical protein
MTRELAADEALDILRGCGGQTVTHGSDLWQAIERAIVEIDRIRAAARAVTLSASPRSPDGHRRSVDANALFALDELAIDHGVAPTYVSVKASEVERLRGIETRAWTVATTGASEVIRDAALWIHRRRG